MLLLMSACAPQKPQPSASQYRFSYNDEVHRIRSIFSEDKKESYNELVGKNFVAADFDQDRVLDRILFGETSLSEAQKIYEHGLARLAQENKLQVRIPRVARYVYEKNGSQIEIRSFRPANARPFNEFVITDHRQAVHPEIIIIVDQNADGILDQVLKGAVALEKVQPQYTQAIAAGLRKRELIEVNNTILVREK